MELFSAQKVAEFRPSEPTRTCHYCGQRLKLIRTFVDQETGKFIHIFECQCGERLWDD